MDAECGTGDQRRPIEIGSRSKERNWHKWHVVRSPHTSGHVMADGERRQNLTRRREVHLGTHQHDRIVFADVLARDVVQP